mmetsp:Transcript_73820/g.171219  ORF Transcript_73820/g.171219 Transcript_73820/m.171219 type:complete len:463 (+) Transcript_73820:189-1577(+)
MLLIWALVLHVVSKARVCSEQQPCYSPSQLPGGFEEGTEDTDDSGGEPDLLAGRSHRVPSEERREYTESKLDIDLRVIRSFASQTVLPPRPGQVQVAFLFLTMDKLHFEEVWQRFFNGAKVGPYKIYVHQAKRWNTPKRTEQLPLQNFGAVEVEPVETGWCALMGVEVALLAAALQDPRNTQFVFLAHDTVPLKKFDYVYEQLAINSPQTSKFCFADKAFTKSATIETVRNEWLRECVFRDFYRDYNPRTLKHHQWVVLSRGHAHTVVRRAEEALRLWNESWQKAAPDLTYRAEGCSDEAVPVTALLRSLQDDQRSTGNTWADFTRLGVEQQCLTFVFWRHCFGKTELYQGETFVKELDLLWRHGDFRMLTARDFDFFKSPLKRELNGYPAVFDRLRMGYLRKLVSQGFMFARKFVQGIKVEDKGKSVPLESALEKLWGNPELNASQKIWSRLSSEGVPRPV